MPESSKVMAEAACWRLLHDNPAPAVWNMAADEAMLIALNTGKILPTLRFYGWSPPAVSVGYFQKLSAEIDIEVCKAQKIDVVRRLTGGRAVLHDLELTYSLVVREDAPGIPGSVTESYLYFSRAIVAGLQRLGIMAQMQQPEPQRSVVRSVFSAACFDAPSHYEITVAGRKLVGSAQVRRDGVLLQHGSILLTLNPQRQASVMKSAHSVIGRDLADALTDRAIGLFDVLGRQVELAEILTAFQAGFEAECGLLLQDGCRTEEEQAIIRDLAQTKYSSETWNFRR